MTSEQIGEGGGRAFREVCPALTRDMSDAAAIDAFVESRSVGEGERLVTAGETADTIFFVASGGLRSYVESIGRRLELGTVVPGGWTGEVQVLEPGPAIATLEASAPTTVLALSRERLDAFRAAAPGSAHALVRGLARGLAGRLRAVSGAVSAVDESDAYEAIVRDDEKRRGWLASALSRLFGAKESA